MVIYKAGTCLNSAVVTDVGDGQHVVVETRIEHERYEWRVATTSSAERLL